MIVVLASNIIILMSGREIQHAEPTPSLSARSSLESSFPHLFQGMLLGDSYNSHNEMIIENDDEMGAYKKPKKTQKINKTTTGRKNSTRETMPKETSQKRITRLQGRIKELEEEIDKLRRKYECCPHCYHSLSQLEEKREGNFPPVYDEELIKLAHSVDSPRGSRGSMEFQKMDFNTVSMMNKEMDDKAWIFLGTMMIVMGSKCMDIDGTINVYKILKESVDSLRRQVEKSSPNITMDFFLCKEEMQESIIAEEIGFDPFTQKMPNSGLLLEGLKVESVQEFELIYDNKLTYSIKYEALITAMQYAREGCWISSP